MWSPPDLLPLRLHSPTNRFLAVPCRAVPAAVVRHARTAHRLRIALPELHQNRPLARRLEAELATRDDVADVRADVRTGRMLIQYRDGASLLSGMRALVEPPTP